MAARLHTLQPVSSKVVPCAELEVSEIVKYWKLKSENYPMNQEAKLKCIYRASKLTEKYKPSGSTCYDFDSFGPIVHIMREALLDGDPFVRYSAAVAMGDILNHFDSVDFTQVLNDMVSTMSTMQYGWRVSILDLLWHQLSQSESKKNWHVAVTVVGQKWMYLCELCLFNSLAMQHEDSSSCLIKQSSEKVIMHCQFLQLWKRIIKRYVSSKQEQIVDFLKPVFKLVSMVRPKILLNRMAFRAVLKLIYIIVKNVATISEFEGAGFRDVSVQLAKSLVDCFSSEWFEEFPCDFRDGFGGELTINSNNHQNFIIRRTVGNICMKLVSNVPGLDMDSSSNIVSSTLRILISLDAWMGRTTALHGFLWVPAVYSEQDDAWIDILLTLLEIYIDRKSRLKEEEACTVTQDALNMIQPHKQFLLFLDNTGFDDSLILDLLISPETCFLSYFIKYLRVIPSEWTDFVSTHSEYRSNTSVDRKLDSMENMHSAEAELSSDEENIFMTQNAESVNMKNSGPEMVTSHGLTLLHQYGGDDEEEEMDNEEEEDIKMSMGKFYHNVVDQTIDTEFKFETSPTKINKCLEETMSVLIRVRLKMEKYKDSSILPYDPTVLIHLIEKVEEIYEQ